MLARGVDGGSPSVLDPMGETEVHDERRAQPSSPVAGDGRRGREKRLRLTRSTQQEPQERESKAA